LRFYHTYLIHITATSTVTDVGHKLGLIEYLSLLVLILYSHFTKNRA